VSDIREFTEVMRHFSEEREWTQFHDPKSLALALVGEVGELAALLQWLPAAGIDDRVREARLNQRLGEELADVFLYLVRLADVLDVDLTAAADQKLRANAARYDVGEYFGKAPERP
jgi:NTP pyrophosphatase (non-canonical NTP hydrolase)